MRLIDLWDLSTFDGEVLGLLQENTETIRSYFLRDREIFETDRKASIFDRPHMRPENEYWKSYLSAERQLHAIMKLRSIRAFHNTRLTDSEVENLLREGIHLSTPASLHVRLSRLVDAGYLTDEEVASLKDSSPFQTQRDGREGMFWMTSHPLPVSDGGLEGLLGIWGGEVSSFHLGDLDLKAKLSNIGRPRVLEIAVPLSATKHIRSATKAAVATFASTLCSISDRKEFDLYVEAPLPAQAVLRVNSEGDYSYEKMGLSYPMGLPDRDD